MNKLSILTFVTTFIALFFVNNTLFAQTQNIGTANIGSLWNSEKWAGFTHKDLIGNADTQDYAFAQNSTGLYTLINKKDTGNGFIAFRIGNVNKMILNHDGRVGIGIKPTEFPDANTYGDYKLTVAGGVLTEFCKVQLQADWPDYVFQAQYQLPSLSTVENYIKDNGHLPNIPSAQEIADKGNAIDLGEMTTKQQEKIEELFLYIIELKKEIEALKN